MLVAVSSLLLLCTLAIIPSWHKYMARPANRSPFTAQMLTSVTYPLYYPSHLPSGYSIDYSSVSQPQPGIIILDFKDDHNHTIYMSQEARPLTFDFGGYYRNFTQLQEVLVGNNTIAVGYINGNRTLVGSIALDKTWVIVNTNAPLPPFQFIDTLKSLTQTY